MNITELARRVKIPTEQLKDIIPQLGFDVGRRAIKIDDRVAREIIHKLDNPAVREKFLVSTPADRQPSQNEATAGVHLKEGVVQIPDSITVKDFAVQLHIPVTQLILTLMRNGVMAAQNEKIDFETASIVAEDFGFTPERILVTEESDDAHVFEATESLAHARASAGAVPRPPVVVVMGHVDHGKTKLLDAIRKANVVAEEHGGITQHIGAYQAQHAGRLMTFIDTPGHEAFTAMRSRGARVADIAVLVVAADDGVQPQTIEALSHIQRAALPFIVAINKMDKEGADINRVKQGLADVNVLAEDWGGSVPTVPLSALRGTGIDDLLEVVLLVADLHKESISADPALPALGTVIESRIDKGEGPVATVLVQSGTLHQGDTIQVGDVYGKIKAMHDFHGLRLEQAPPSMPARILGLKSVARVGDVLKAVDPVEAAKSMRKKKKLKGVPEVAQARLIAQEEMTGQKKVNILVKADVLGSLEAILEALEPIMRQSGKSLHFIAKGLGAITESDIFKASEHRAKIIGFNVSVMPAAEETARVKGVDINIYTVIYHLVDEIKAQVEAALPPEVVRTELGTVKVLKVFRAGKHDSVLGCSVQAGRVVPKSLFEIRRHTKFIGRGELAELQAGKEAVAEVVEGQECGMRVTRVNEVQPGDMLSFYTEEKRPRTIHL